MKNLLVFAAFALLGTSRQALAQTETTVLPPVVIDHTDAVYPAHRLAENIDTTSVLLVTVERDGSVGEAQVAQSGGVDFDAQALTAIRKWRFAPATRNGVQVRARIRVPFHFAPGPHPPVAVHPHHVEQQPAEPPHEVEHGAGLPHAVDTPGQPIEIHVEGRAAPPRRGASDYRIDSRFLSLAPQTDAGDLLKRAPGVYVMRPEGEAVSHRVMLRGFDADHGQDIEFSVSGIPLNQPSHIHGQGYADLNIVVPEVVRSLRVLAGNYDPQQGDFAVAGSVDYDLGIAERGAHFKLSYGSWNTRRFLAMWAPEASADETFAVAVFRESDGFGEGTRASTSGGAMGQYRFELANDFHALLHVAGYGARAGTAGVLRRDDVTRGVVGFYDSYQDNASRSQSAAATRTQTALSVEHSSDDGSNVSGLVWASLSNFRSRLNFTGYRERSRLRPTWIGFGDNIEQSNEDFGLGGELTYRSRRFEPDSWVAAQLMLGASARTHNIEQQQNLVRQPQNDTWDNRVDAEIATSDIGWFGDVLLTANKRARLRLGARADLLFFDVDDKLQNFIPEGNPVTHLPGFRRTAAGLAWGPRGSLEIDVLPWLRAVAAYGEGYRSPQARQLEEGERAPFATVQSAEVGAHVLPTKDISINVALFQTHLSYDLAFEASEGSLERIGPTTRRGFALDMRATPSEHFTAAINGTFVHATLDEPPVATSENPTPAYEEGQRLPFVPPFVLRGDVGYSRELFDVVGEPLEARIGYGASFLSARPLPYDTYGTPIFLVDASVGARVGAVEVGLDFLNLLDAEYAESEYSFVSDFGTTPAPSHIPARHFTAGAPFTIMATLGVHL